ncbi:beta-ketoacyl synthase [Anopheles sinensis]|uniref:Beta-ketoacyl synthase n=1 Tax=Anopheles sinensis TaxID=74873 RepID=A0A084VU42_ANOSI|nr:beta-ketoacyl synthase [Anopheles sinensis]
MLLTHAPVSLMFDQRPLLPLTINLPGSKPKMAPTNGPLWDDSLEDGLLFGLFRVRSSEGTAFFGISSTDYGGLSARVPSFECVARARLRKGHGAKTVPRSYH